MVRGIRATSWRFFAIAALLLIASLAASEVAWAQEGSSVEDDEDLTEVLPDSEGGSDISDVVPVETEGGPDEAIEEEPVLSPAPGIQTVYVFPGNPDKVIPAGQTTELVVGLSNGGQSEVKVLGIKGALVHPIDFRVVVQNFTIQEFNSTVPPGVQASFFYTFTPQRQLLPREFGLSTFLLYEVDSSPYMSVGYNGTIEITEPRGSVSGESIFLLLLASALLGLLGMWGYSQLQKFSKKSRRAKKLETGTKESEVADNEWLQGTALTQKQPKYTSQPVKAKKKRNT